MSRLLLALRCFFAVLLRFKLPEDAVALLPPPDLGPGTGRRLDSTSDAQLVERTPEPAPPPPPPAPEPPPAAAAPVEPMPASVDVEGIRRRGAVQLLALLQREGRLLDFLMESIDSYSDAQIGAAVRDIHRGCKKGLAEHLKILPIRPEPDEAVVRIPQGHDPSQVRLIGQVTGRPPFEGTLRHHGWRTASIQLQDVPPGHDPSVICPAEVEISA